MDKIAFQKTMETIIASCLPDEEMVFEIAGANMIDELFATGAITQKAVSGDVEFIQVETAKTVLECIPALCACYKLVKAAAQRVSRKIDSRPSQEELYDLLIRSGAPPLFAQRAVENCRDALEQLTVQG